MKVLILSLLAFLPLLSIHAIERDTHGGGAVVCRNAAWRNINHVELLDVWEGREIYGLEYPKDLYRNGGDPDWLISKILKYIKGRVHPTFHTLLSNEISYLKDNTRKTDLGIMAPSDANNGFVKYKCGLEGVAIFKDIPDNPTMSSTYPGQLWINKAILGQMDSFNKAALYFHEAIYRILRKQVGAKDSRLARYITANLLSKNPQYYYFYGETYACKDIFYENTFYVMEMKTNTIEKRTWIQFINAYSSGMHPQNKSFFPEGQTPTQVLEAKPKLIWRINPQIKFEYNWIDRQGLPVGYYPNTSRDFEPTLCNKLF